jgi:hypothetical protein
MITKIAKFVKVEDMKDANCILQAGGKTIYFKIVIEEGENK